MVEETENLVLVFLRRFDELLRRFDEKLDRLVADVQAAYDARRGSTRRPIGAHRSD